MHAKASTLKRDTLENRTSVISRGVREIDNGLDFQLHPNEKKPFHEFDTLRDQQTPVSQHSISYSVCSEELDESRIVVSRECV